MSRPHRRPTSYLAGSHAGGPLGVELLRMAESGACDPCDPSRFTLTHPYHVWKRSADGGFGYYGNARYALEAAHMAGDDGVIVTSRAAP